MSWTEKHYLWCSSNQQSAGKINITSLEILRWGFSVMPVRFVRPCLFSRFSRDCGASPPRNQLGPLTRRPSAKTASQRGGHQIFDFRFFQEKNRNDPNVIFRAWRRWVLNDTVPLMGESVRQVVRHNPFYAHKGKYCTYFHTVKLAPCTVHQAFCRVTNLCTYC